MRLSLQLYTVRDQLSADPAATYKAVKEIGMEYVEGGGSYGADSAKEGRQMLDDHGLKASGSHIGLDRLEGGLEEALEVAYHNHDFEFKNEGKPGLDVLFESSDPALVKSELDIAWVQIGGRDPA